MSNFTALYDACVLYPAPLRDLLMHLALTDLFRAKWSDEIHEEWIRSLLEQRKDLGRAQLERTRDLMNAHVRDCLVTGYEELIPSLTLPDANDRHVLAAAIRAGASVIVTYNVKHFPDDVLERYGIDAQHPDAFITHLIDLAANQVCAAAKRHRENLRNPPKTVEEYLAALERQGLAQTVAELRRYAALI
ncbi:MAG TPA: PIN domain-containing protein [Planctomycetota bacterium]|jgi:predicted nucleic acid-binding protein